jgi:meso-butanediol dehydrogenase / (S,S)-butanediol dehydrogenase / diacetyl reductase
MKRFDGQVAIVTGSGSGTGQAIAARVAEDCGSVCVADIDLKGAFFCAQAVLPDMQARGSGSIVNVDSVNGFHDLGNAAYSAAKAGLTSLTGSLGVRYGRAGIRTNLVAPGTIRTAAWDDRLARDLYALDQLASN